MKIVFCYISMDIIQIWSEIEKVMYLNRTRCLSNQVDKCRWTRWRCPYRCHEHKDLKNTRRCLQSETTKQTPIITVTIVTLLQLLLTFALNRDTFCIREHSPVYLLLKCSMRYWRIGMRLLLWTEGVYVLWSIIIHNSSNINPSTGRFSRVSVNICNSFKQWFSYKADPT